MLAKFHLLLPFNLTVPIGEEYKLYGFDEDGHHIFFEPPSASGKPKNPDDPEHVEINGKPATQADVITICFQRNSFERRIDSPIDPPEELIQRTLDSFFARLKYVANECQRNAAS